MNLKISILLVGLIMILVVGCSKPSEQVIDLKRFPLDNLDGIITKSGIQFDRETSSDGLGSVRISVEDSTTVRLFEINDLNVENSRLIYRAKIRTEGIEGPVYLEMWCHFPGKGEFFSRGLQNPLSGTTDWTTEEIPFFLNKGDNPDMVKLNLVVNGKGIAWIDDIRLLSEQ